MNRRGVVNLLEDQRRRTRAASEGLKYAISTDCDVDCRALIYLATVRSFRRIARTALEADWNERRFPERAA